MKFKFYRSATIGIEINGFKILQDPWLTDGEYYGSWSHYPYFDIKSNLSEINSYDIIYISHIHPDHCSDETMKHIDKSIPVYIHKYHAKFLKLKLERLGFKVVELENGTRYSLNESVNINIFAADNCDPELCYKFTGCANLNIKGNSQQIDTLSIIDDNKNTIMNVNDCPYDLAKSTFQNIKKQYDKIDILLTGYGGAGPYPQCFDNLNIKEKEIAANNKQQFFLSQATKYINELQPHYYFPFAGTYTLTGNLSKLQNLRGVPSIDFAYNYLEKYFNDRNNSKIIRMNPDDTFDLDKKSADNPYIKINMFEYEEYIKNNLSNKKLIYENNNEPELEELYELSKTAFNNFIEKRILNNISLKTDILIDIKNKFIRIPKDTNEINLVNKDEFDYNSKFVIYKTNPKLLKLLLKGPRYAHWNNAEIGSHINFFRKPNVFEREVYISMCFFHN